MFFIWFLWTGPVMLFGVCVCVCAIGSHGYHGNMQPRWHTHHHNVPIGVQGQVPPLQCHWKDTGCGSLSEYYKGAPLHICACMCVCVCVCVCECMHMHVCVKWGVGVHVHCMHACTCMCVHKYMHVYRWEFMCARMHVCACFVMGYVLWFGEIAYKRVHYYY